MTSAYGAIVTGFTLRRALRDTIRLWLPSYAAEMQRQATITLPPVRAYTVGVAPGFPEDQLPAVVTATPGLTGDVSRRGDGTFDVTWAVGLGIVVSAPSRDDANDLADAYTGALKALVLQQPSLGGFADGLEWIDEEVTEVAWTTERSVYAGILQFEVFTRGVVNASAGLTQVPTPDAVIPVDAPVVSGTHISLDRSV